MADSQRHQLTVAWQSMDGRGHSTGVGEAALELTTSMPPMLIHTALGLALGLFAAMPLARKWELPPAGVLITLTVAAVVAGSIVEVFSRTVPLESTFERSLLVVALVLAQGLAFLAYRFFRDPERVPPLGMGTVVSPADGEVRYVTQTRAGVLPVATKHGPTTGSRSSPGPSSRSVKPS
jgi:Phosphatidylserine decarboxylase